MSKIKKPLVIVGRNGWKSEKIRARIKELELRGLVRHEGYVTDARLAELYRTATALIFPSHYEGFGLPSWRR